MLRCALNCQHVNTYLQPGRRAEHVWAMLDRGLEGQCSSAHGSWPRPTCALLQYELMMNRTVYAKSEEP